VPIDPRRTRNILLDNPLFKQNFYARTFLNYCREPLKLLLSPYNYRALRDKALYNARILRSHRHAANKGTIGRIVSMRNIRTPS